MLEEMPRENTLAGQAALPVARADGHPRAIGSRRGFAVAPRPRRGGNGSHTAVRARRRSGLVCIFVCRPTLCLQILRLEHYSGFRIDRALRPNGRQMAAKSPRNLHEISIKY